MQQQDGTEHQKSCSTGCIIIKQVCVQLGVFMILFLPFHYQDLISNSPYCLPYNSYDVNSENLALDQLKISALTFFFILMTCLLDIILILEGDILSWPVMELRVKSLLLINYSSLKQYYICLSKKLIYLQNRQSLRKNCASIISYIVFPQISTQAPIYNSCLKEGWLLEGGCLSIFAFKELYLYFGKCLIDKKRTVSLFMQA